MVKVELYIIFESEYLLQAGKDDCLVLKLKVDSLSFIIVAEVLLLDGESISGSNIIIGNTILQYKYNDLLKCLYSKILYEILLVHLNVILLLVIVKKKIILCNN